MNENRKVIVGKFVGELAEKFKRSKQDLMNFGLQATDFKGKVSVLFEDGSTMNFNCAFVVINDYEYGVFTEHCGYYVFTKEGIEVKEQ